MKPQRIKPVDTRTRENRRTTCSVEGCVRPVLAGGLCGAHCGKHGERSSAKHEERAI